jgi:hypothetical protein
MNIYILTPFLGGIFVGLNKRSSEDFRPDPFAHYKIMGLSAFGGSLHSTVDYFKKVPPPSRVTFSPYFFGGILGGLVAGSAAYWGGLLLTKIPDKELV